MVVPLGSRSPIPASGRQSRRSRSDHTEFADGLAEAARRKLVYDAAIFDRSLPKIAALADRLPGLTIVLDHVGRAVGIAA